MAKRLTDGPADVARNLADRLASLQQAGLTRFTVLAETSRPTKPGGTNKCFGCDACPIRSDCLRRQSFGQAGPYTADI